MLLCERGEVEQVRLNDITNPKAPCSRGSRDAVADMKAGGLLTEVLCEIMRNSWCVAVAMMIKYRLFGKGAVVLISAYLLRPAGKKLRQHLNLL